MATTNRNLLCVFCYKSATTSVEAASLNSRFINLLSRYLEIKSSNRNESKIKSSFVVCEDCSHLGESFCDLYFQLECIKMEINWKTSKICDTMVHARKVPARYLAFKEQFEENGDENDEFKTIQEFRKGVISKSKKKLNSSEPHLVLQRQPVVQDNPNDTSSSVELKSVEPPPVPSTSQSLAPVPTPEKIIIETEAEKDAVDNYEVEDNSSTNLISIQKLSFQLEDSENDIQHPDEDPLEFEPEEEVEESNAVFENMDEHEQDDECLVETILEVGEGTFAGIEIDLDTQDAEEDVEMNEQGILHSILSIGNDNDYEELDDMEDVPSLSSSPAAESDTEEEVEFVCDYDYQLENMEEVWENPVTCERCGRELACEAALEKHRVLVHKLKYYVRCSPCHKMFESFAHYRKHRLSKRRTNKCFTTDKNSVVPAAISEYPPNDETNQMDDSSTPHFCPKKDCFELFQSESKLQTHLTTHGEWKCSKCSRTFSKAHRLAWHEVEVHKPTTSATAQDSRLLRCTRCKATFSQRIVLTDHFLQKHLALAPPVSKTRSQSRAAVERQGSSGSGTPSPRQCPICKMPLPPSQTRAVIQRHVKKWHYVGDMDPSEIAKCDVCQAPFTSQRLLNDHFKIVHKLV